MANEIRLTKAGIYVEYNANFGNPPPIPTAPTSLTATAISTSQIDLGWTDNATNEDGFKIERSPDGSTGWTQIGTTGANTTTYSNTGLSAATTYYYRVRAYNGSGDSSYSNTANATTQAATPSAPSSLTATAISGSQINLSWTDNASNETGFKIERSPNGSTGWTQIGTTGADTTTYSDTGLTELNTYYYRVRAYNGSGDSSYSNTANATTELAAPTSLVATPTGATSIYLAWTDNSGAESNFAIERSLDGSTGWTQIGTTVTDVVAYTDTGLTADTSYYYRVKATQGGTSSDYSNVAAATTLVEGAAGVATAASNDPQGIYMAIESPTGDLLLWPGGLVATPQWYGSTVLGGPDQADIQVAGPLDALWDMLRRLGHWVQIRNRDHQIVWSGMIEEVLIQLGGLSVGLSLKNMYNRVQVVYTDERQDVEMETTWSENSESINRYGYKELRYNMDGTASQSQAEAQRDTLLNTFSAPAPLVSMAEGAPGGTLRCVGLFSTLAWRHYENLAGLEEHANSNGIQALGQGFTDDTIAFTTDSRIHDTLNRLDALAAGDRISVSGSTSNDGWYLLDASGVDGEVYTATTIELDPSDDINDSGEGLGHLNDNDIISITGSAANSGMRRVTAALGSSHVTVNVPPNFTFEAEGPSITIDQAGSVRVVGTLLEEFPAATVTLTVHGQKVASTFTLGANTASWTAASIAIRAKKVGAPADSLKVELCADSSGAPGTVLDSATVAATNIEETSEWVIFTLANTQALSFGSTYWIVVSRTGANDIDDYYLLDVDEDLGYTRGELRLYTGSEWTVRATDADLVFRILGSVQTTTQLQNLYTACGQFFRRLDVVDNSGVYSNQYRDGATDGLAEIEKLLKSGTSSGTRMLATVTPERILRVYAQPASAGEENMQLASDGTVREITGQPLAPGVLPAGRWLRLADVPGNVDALAGLANIFIERAEYQVAEGGLRLEAQGTPSPWDL